MSNSMILEDHMRQLLISLLVCTSWVYTYAQISAIPDTGRMVTLSERVGPVINPAEREKYDLFASILVRHFGSTSTYRSAVVLQFPDSTFRVRFTVARENEPPRDTLVLYSAQVLWRLAEKIENFEVIRSGVYKEEQLPSPLFSATGDLILPRGSGKSLTQRGYGKLPLASAEGYVYPRWFTAVHLGIGLRTYSPDLSGLSEALGRNPSLRISPLLSALTEVALAEEFSLRIEGAISIGGSKCYHFVIEPVYYIKQIASKSVRPFVSAGVLICSLDGEVSGIIVKAGGTGFSGTVGMEMLAGSAAALELYGSYCALPKVTTTFADWTSPSQRREVPASLNLSSLIFGLRIKILG
jgi:hypothetical protein